MVIGGAFSGAAFACLLRHLRPRCRVLVVESQTAFPRKVGESTVEVTSWFLRHVLGAGLHLSRHQLPKHGLRYWFSQDGLGVLDHMSEVGPRSEASVPTFQIDRSRLDEELLQLAAQRGAEVCRPGRVLAVEGDWPERRVRIRSPGATREVRSRWVVDASGRRAFLARRWRLLERVESHPTAAAWARWRGVADLDELAAQGPAASPRLPPLAASRRLATNHFCGYGWWCWVIPLAGGETSVGLVWHKGLFELPGEGPVGRRYKRFLTTRTGLRELLSGARMDDGDFQYYGHLPYRTKRYAGRGWGLLGDAAAFLDPYLSSGLDHACLTVYSTAHLVAGDLAPGREAAEELEGALEEHNARFLRSYGRWLEALYVGKYELMGDAELLGCSFLVDSALYYLGVVNAVHRDPGALGEPYFGLDTRRARASYHVVRRFKERLVLLARRRRQAGLYGRRNRGWRFFARPFGLGARPLGPLVQGLGIWLRLEMETLRARALPRPLPSVEEIPEVKLNKGIHD